MCWLQFQITRTSYGLLCSSSKPFTTLQLTLLKAFVDADRQVHGFPVPSLDTVDVVHDSEELQGSDEEHSESDEDYDGSEYDEDEEGFYSDDEAWNAAVEDEDVSFIFISMWVDIL